MSSPEITLELFSSDRDREGDLLRLGKVSVDGAGGELVYVGRVAHMLSDAGLAPLPKEAFNAVLADEVDRIAGLIWGDDWSRALAELAGINRRTTARDRVKKFGLPPDLVRGLVRLSERDDAREVAGIARAVARYWDTHAAAPPEQAMDGMMRVIGDFRGPGHFDRWLDGLMGIDWDEGEGETIP